MVVWKNCQLNSKKVAASVTRDADNHSDVNEVEYEEVKDPYYSTIPSQIQTTTPSAEDTRAQGDGKHPFL